MNYKDKIGETREFIWGRFKFLFDHTTEGDGEIEEYHCGGWRDEAMAEIEHKLTALYEQAQRDAVTGETSDGYHTFNELYEFRKLYNAGLFNEWAKQGLFNVHKSKRHSDGAECFGGGWFIVMATLPTGQISNHYELKDWDLFQCSETENSAIYDGHTAQDVAKRLEQYLNQTKEDIKGKIE